MLSFVHVFGLFILYFLIVLDTHWQLCVATINHVGKTSHKEELDKIPYDGKVAEWMVMILWEPHTIYKVVSGHDA